MFLRPDIYIHLHVITFHIQRGDGICSELSPRQRHCRIQLDGLLDSLSEIAFNGLYPGYQD